MYVPKWLQTATDRFQLRTSLPVLDADAQSGPLTVSAGQELGAGWADADIQAMAAEDGSKELFTQSWGPDNHFPRVAAANVHAAGVAGHLIGHQLFGALNGVQMRLEDIEARAATLIAATLAQMKRLGRTRCRRDDVERKIRDEDLALPDTRRRRFLQEVGWLTVLAVGDMLLISLAFQLFGLSDKPLLGFLPFSELQLAASTAIAALQVLARITGHRMKRCLHLFVVSVRDWEGGTSGERRGRIAQLAETGVQCLGGLLGLGVLLFGLNAVRSRYLASVGIDGQGTSFLLIQLGIAAAGVLIAAHYAHPYDEEWRSVSETAAEASAALDGQVAELTALKSAHSSLIREHENAKSRYLEWEGATNRNVERQNELYARGVILSQPEPTTERLFDDELPKTVGVDWADALRTPGRTTAPVLIAKRYEPLDLSGVLDQLKKIEDDIEPSATPTVSTKTAKRSANGRGSRAARDRHTGASA
jgi:hypothetical protein